MCETLILRHFMTDRRKRSSIQATNKLNNKKDFLIVTYLVVHFQRNMSIQIN